MNPSKIEWTNKVANPIKAKCRHKCSWDDEPYCYMYEKNFYKRLDGASKQNENIIPYSEDQVILDLECLKAPKIRNQTIFIGSGTDVFGKWVPKDFIEQIILELGKLHKSNTIIFLTKNAERYLEFSFLNNMICGITIETDLILPGYSTQAPLPHLRLAFLISKSIDIDCKHILISIEPILKFSPQFLIHLLQISKLKFLILGFNTSHRKMTYPTGMEVLEFIDKLYSLNEERNLNISLLIKPNIAIRYSLVKNCYPIRLAGEV